MKNVFEAADARQKQAKKRSLCLIKEHFETVFNAAAATQKVFQRPDKAGVKIHTVYDPHASIPTFFEMGEARAHDAKAVTSLPLLPGATYVFDRAYHDYDWYAKLTKQNSYFVGRMKTNTVFEVISSQQVADRVSADETIRLTSAAGNRYPGYLRRIVYTTEEGKALVFITNDFKRPAQAIADLYKMRWQIELFFKWIKQNLKIKRFLGTSKNAVLIQITVAIIAYLLVRLTQHSVPNSLSMQQWVRLICVNIFARKQLEFLGYSPPKSVNNTSTQHLIINRTVVIIRANTVPFYVTSLHLIP